MMKFIAPIVAIVVAIAVFFGYIDPTYEEIKGIREEVSQYDEALAKSRELEAVRDQLLITYNGFDEEELARLKKLLPDNVDNVRLIMDIDSIASRYGLVLRGVSVSETAQTPDAVPAASTEDAVAFIDVSFSVTSSYENFLTFLEELERSLRLVDVTSLSFESSEIDLYEFKVNLRTYWLR